MTTRLPPQREAEIREQIANAIYPTYGQENRNRSLAIADLVMPAVQEAVAAELTAVRAERDEARAEVERLKGQRSFLLKQIQTKDARSGEATALPQFLQDQGEGTAS
ncbi:hypothetical protein ABZ383_27400 [Streptomyces sp. NPDC005900]|uniref:hypothetical protein n=1 Tax=Streptomyces sp. NPDC005900 TaxID=3154569 RepID=UPI00340653DB